MSGRTYDPTKRITGDWRLYYQIFEMAHAAFKPARAMADTCRIMLQHPFNPLSHTPVGRSAAAACEVFERTTRRYGKPAFDLPTTTIDGETIAVTEEIVWEKPFCRLIHFKREIDAAKIGHQPKLLLVAPMSGHFATLLRGTVETFLPDHEVYITDWTDARDVPVMGGSFDLDDYIDYIADICRSFGGDLHIFAVCQPSVPVLAAIAHMEANGDKNVPHSVVLAGGPIDTRVSPTVVNQLAEKKGVDWFRRNVIHSVPWPSVGFGRKVYPGFLQLTGFMTMNLDRHMKAHKDLFFHLVDGDGDNAEKHREFYDEYLAVMDLTAEFYLQTVETVFVEHRLPRGLFKHRGQSIDLGKIKSIGLMTVEGEKDDITGIGQCSAAITLCSGIPVENKQHFECPKVGHYGIFNGSRFRSEIAPRMRHFFRRFDPVTAAATARDYKPSLAIVAKEPGESGKSKGKRDHDAEAFSFPRPTDDSVPVPAVTARVTGLEQSTPMASMSAAPIGMAMTTSALKLWSMTGLAMFDGLARSMSPSPVAKPERRG